MPLLAYAQSSEPLVAPLMTDDRWEQLRSSKQPDAWMPCGGGRAIPNIEGLFGLMKRGYGYARVRYRSLRRNGTQLQLLCLAINLRRMLVLTA